MGGVAGGPRRTSVLEVPMLRLLTSFILLLLVAQPALAASGKAMGVDPAARLEDKSGTKTLVVGTDVFIGDRVVTDAKGLVQILFSDKTKLVVGPRSALVLEDYLLREDGSGGKFAINALSGTFRFVTGGAPKDRYLITTPTGTVGVRGTAFDLNVHEDHYSLLLFHGAVVMCNKANKCITVDDFCDVGMADLADARLLGNTEDFVGAERTSMRGMFPWAVSESDLLSPFWVTQARECLNRAVVPNTTDAGGGNPDNEPPPNRSPGLNIGTHG
ncbi:MAG: hypothetical protein ABS35_37910 [Kaistia sp. SCN 65-12]|jgi:hypothetical protein|nr:MAG: hypothetical protein ABS35_37910 [Kaistia sp. SCN 65-12]